MNAAHSAEEIHIKLLYCGIDISKFNGSRYAESGITDKYINPT